MRKLIFFSFFVIVASNLYAQKDTIHLKNIEKASRNIVTDRAPQAVYFQLGGSGPILSVNYDRRFQKKLNGLGFAVGIGYFGVEGVSLFSVPVSLNYLFGHNSHFVELAAGTTFVSAQTSDFFGSGSNSGSGFLYHINVGYRYQPTTGGFFFRGGVSPIFTSASDGGGHITSYYLGFGHNF